MRLKLSLEADLEVLIESCLQGNCQACEQLIRDPNYQKLVEKIARKQTRGTLITWEDAAQTAHYKVLQALNNGKFNQGNIQQFYHWAATVARFAIIDLVRHETQRHYISLDQSIPGTNLSLLENIPDHYNYFEQLERHDHFCQLLELVFQINQRYPHRLYLQLWQGKVQGKTQKKLAQSLGLTQSTISKRWQELMNLLKREIEPGNCIQDFSLKSGRFNPFILSLK